MPTIKAGEVNLEYYVEGNVPPLLLVMGLAGQANAWGEPVMSQLREHFTCIRYSHRGTGGSDKPESRLTIRTMADDAATLMDALDIERAHVFGISMGGMVSQEIVLNYPERVNGLILGCTTPGWAHGQVPSPEDTAGMVPQPGLSPEEQADRFWPVVCAPAFIENSAEFLKQMIETNLAQPTPIQTLMKRVAAAQAFDSFDRLGQIKAPTLVIHGDIDLLIPPANGDVLAAAITGAEKLTLSGAAHMFFWERPEESAGAVIEFLARVPAEA